ncbi:MAG: CPBP family intramembrane metalloprotease [Sedimentisphaerales bacterium]|nr:CPBP family intramembrane metalloprotease [Sedimentisphaerales bacterium]
MNAKAKVPVLSSIVNFPIIKICIALFLVYVPTFILRSIAEFILYRLAVQNEAVIALVLFGVSSLTVYFMYVLFVNTIEKRPMHELKLDSSALKQTASGGLLGFLTITSVLALLWVTGTITSVGINPDATLLPSVFHHLFFAFLQDVVYFAILFRILEKSLGSWPAIAIAALAFGFKHLLLPGYTLWTVTAQAIEAGLLFSALFILTRRIWCILGFHFAWNFIVSGLIVFNQSRSLQDLFLVTVTGPDFLTGQPIGSEASFITFIVRMGLGLFS